jgi:tetratricopeptide (TPR) repeat protein/tRNA A-37 threonylcarbamoyl transferase component Bud32
MSTEKVSEGLVDETLRKRFETAWVRGRPEPIEQFLPGTDDPSYLTTLETLVFIELECAWKSWSRMRQEADTAILDQTETQPARVETYLERFEPLNRPDVVLRLVRRECSVRRLFGDEVSIDEYRRRFPDLPLADELFAPEPLGETQPREQSQHAGGRASSTDGSTLPTAQTAEVDRPAMRVADTVDLPVSDIRMAETVAPGGAGVTGDVSGIGGTRGFGNYELLGEIGKGGMGIVYRARQRTADRVVALKVIRRDKLETLPRDTQASAVDRFWHEAQAAAQLEHDNIVTVYEVGEVEGQPFFSMRYVEGRSLAEILRDGPIENRPAARYMEPVARAVEEAHRHGILHRDLKPQNVMVDSKTGRPLVADFGLAKLTEGDSELTRAGEVMGTPSYMSPEQARDSGKVTAAADIYALGATFYHVLTGRPPFHAATPVQTLRQVIDEEPVPPRQLNPSIDRDLETVCLKCLQKEPSRRYESAQALADDLKRYLNGEPILARPVGALERTWRWCRRNPVVAILIGSTFTFLVLALVGTTIGLVQASVARKEAEESFWQAREAVDNFYTRVSEDTLLNEPGMQRLRMELLSEALDYYQRFLAQRGDDPALRDELAVTHFREGSITEAIASPAEALGCYQQARQMQEELLAERPDDPKRMQELGNTLNAMGRALYRQGKLQKAREAYQEAVRLRGRLVERVPEEDEFKRALANSYMNIGQLEQDAGSTDPTSDSFSRARRHFEQAQRLRQDVLRAPGDHLEVQRDLAMGYYTLARFEVAVGDPAAARTNLGEAIRGFEALLKREPRNLANQHRLAVCCRTQADSILQDPNSTDADLNTAHELYDKALGLTQTLALGNPDVAQYQAELAGLYMNRGTLDRFQERPGDALDSFGRAEEILRALVADYPNVPANQENLAGLQMMLGDMHYEQQHRVAATEAFTDAYHTLETLVQRYPRVPEYRRDFAVTIRQIARLQWEAGQRKAARSNLEALVDYLRALIRAFPHVDYFGTLLEATEADLADVNASGSKDG